MSSTAAQPPVILVIGGSGKVGTELVQSLLERKARIRILVRHVENAKSLFGNQVEYVAGDVTQNLDTSVVDTSAFQNVERLFILVPNNPKQVAQELNLVKKVLQQSALTLRQVLKLSVLNADASRPLGDLQRLHGQIENRLEDYLNEHAPQVHFTVLRPNNFMQNLLAEANGIKNEGVLYRPRAEPFEYRISFIDTRDIGEAAATILTENPEKHSGRSYELTGPEALSWDEVVQRISTVANHPVKVVYVDDAGFYNALTFLPEFYRFYFVKLMQTYRVERRSAIIAGDYKLITGKESRKLDDFLKEHASNF
ncbi:hypothetical protein C9374_006624 [Naegleria lovaniensis]|uniref:NmrA-like domain-containing protein n=1 Tax=Naegleria lovaniensis TaxID=51637 RepID=A0AA88GHG4_NAELO|nr:uncharacterized protein C9374_006624 [Naegleria lovaniensis]KAG2379507.1 hypothetical protein C9374_006624 [Naegleria lovaniensis]